MEANSKMNNQNDEIKMTPIDLARNSQDKHYGGWREVMTEVVIDKRWEDALLGLSDYSHIIVVYWMHGVNTCDIRHVPQDMVGEVPEVGIFACRCPARPNPIGVSAVELISINGNVVSVKGLDVINGTPILDIKPYTPQY